MKNLRNYLIPGLAKSQRGIVLLEALIAVLLFSIGILGLVGLQATMLKGTTEGKIYADANYMVSKRIAELWTVESLTLPAYAEVATDISAESGIPTATRTTQISPAGVCPPLDAYCFVVTVNWQDGDGKTRSVIQSAHLNPPPPPP